MKLTDLIPYTIKLGKESAHERQRERERELKKEVVGISEGICDG